MDLAEAVEQVYASDLADFVKIREELVKRARAAGDRGLATQIGKLRKPTRSAWLVNRWARCSDGVEQLAELTELLGEAHRDLLADELRALTRRRIKLINSLTAEVIAGAPSAVSATVQAEIAQILTGALTDRALAQQLRSGTVLEAVAAAGFGTLDLTDGEGVAGAAGPAGEARVIPLRRPGSPPENSDQDPAATRAPGRAEAVERTAQERARRAEEERIAEQARERAAAQRRLQAAAEASTDARRQADEAERTAHEAASVLAQAEAALLAAQGALDTARAEHAEKTTMAATARERAERAERTLAAAAADLHGLGGA